MDEVAQMTTKHFSFVAHGGLDRRLRRERLRPASTRDSVRGSLPGSARANGNAGCGEIETGGSRSTMIQRCTVDVVCSALAPCCLFPLRLIGSFPFPCPLAPPPPAAESGYSFPSPAHSGQSSSHLFVSRRSVSSIASPCNVARRALWLLQLGGFVVTYRRTGAS